MLVRTCLEWLYRVCFALAGFFLVMIAVFTFAQIASRLIGVLVPGTDNFSSFSLVATSFLALAYTLRSGGHIRVLFFLLRRAPRARRRALELWCLTVGALIVGYFAYHAVEMTWESYVFGDMSFGVISVPLWIPQVGMALGVVVLFIAVVDELVRTVIVGEPSYRDDEELAEEEAVGAGATADDP